MRKFLLFAAALLAAPAVFAQEDDDYVMPPNEVMVSIGFSDMHYKPFGKYFNIQSAYSGLELSEIYEPVCQEVHYSPAVSVIYNYHILNWMKVGVTANYMAYWGKEYLNSTQTEIGTRSVHSVYVIPHIEFNAVNTNHFKLYGGLGCGPLLMAGHGHEGDFAKVHFMLEMVPVGIEFGGETVFGMAEVSISNMLIGGRLGVGVRF